jgi:hypothetical protein
MHHVRPGTRTGHTTAKHGRSFHNTTLPGRTHTSMIQSDTYSSCISLCIHTTESTCIMLTAALELELRARCSQTLGSHTHAFALYNTCTKQARQNRVRHMRGWEGESGSNKSGRQHPESTLSTCSAQPVWQKNIWRRRHNNDMRHTHHNICCQCSAAH